MKRKARRQAGFTLIEVVLAALLTAFLAMLLAQGWRSLARPTADLIAWGQLFQEMDIAVSALSRDLGGSLSDRQALPGDGFQGTKKQGRFLGWNLPSNRLQLYFDGGANTGTLNWAAPGDDTVIEFLVDSNRLIRKNSKTGTSYTVAGNVDSMTTAVESADSIRIELVFKFNNYRDANTQEPLTRMCTLIARRSP